MHVMKVTIDEDYNEYAKKEALVLQKYSHPNIIKYVEDFPYQGSWHAIVTEYCNGKLLHLVLIIFVSGGDL